MDVKLLREQINNPVIREQLAKDFPEIPELKNLSFIDRRFTFANVESVKVNPDGTGVLSKVSCISPVGFKTPCDIDENIVQSWINPGTRYKYLHFNVKELTKTEFFIDIL